MKFFAVLVLSLVGYSAAAAMPDLDKVRPSTNQDMDIHVCIGAEILQRCAGFTDVCAVDADCCAPYTCSGQIGSNRVCAGGA